MKLPLGAVVVLILVDLAACSLRFANYYMDNMVLQRGPKKATIWGYADIFLIGEEVTLKVISEGYSKAYMSTVRTGSPMFETEAVWSFDLDPREASSDPYELAVSVRNESASISNVLYGDVWLCSGQSNMVYTLSQSFDGKEEIANSGKYPNIRLFTTSEAFSTVPRYDINRFKQPWSVASPESTGAGDYKYFSAICWWYGKALHEKLGIPIGLITAARGGSVIRSWSSPEALDKCPQPSNNKQSLLWNNLIHPLLNMTISGAIWNQGSSDSALPEFYECCFEAMLEDWRSAFSKAGNTDPVFPFGVGQMYPNSRRNSRLSGVPLLRWAQTASRGYAPNDVLKNTFLATAPDLPDFDSPWGSIHPRDKKTYAERYAYAALAQVYNHTEIRSKGPFPTSIKVDSFRQTLTIQLDDGATKLVVNDVSDTAGFEVCCEKTCTTWDWERVPFTVAEGKSSVILDYRVCGDRRLGGYRYLWSESPCMTYKKCPIYSKKNYLPMPPFIFEEL